MMPAIYTRGEEIANSVIHGIGFLLSIAALSLLTVFAALRGTAWHVVSCAIYGTTLVLLYAASTLYHSLTHPGAKRVFKIIDHSAIYLLIAGTYTPFLLVTLRGPWGWSLFGTLWGLAVAGIAFKIFFTGRFRKLSIALYLAMGWMALIAAQPLIRHLPRGGLLWLLAGGLCYSGGVILYIKRQWPYSHALWHGCVLGGSLCHFFGVMGFVIPW